MRSNMCHVVLLLTAIVPGLFTVSCSADKEIRLGEKIPSGTEVVELEKVLANPSEYNGKNIVMKGTIAGQCPSLCEFFFKDGVHKATIFPQGYKFPKFTTGAPVTVYAGVTAGVDNIAFSALGIATGKETR